MVLRILNPKDFWAGVLYMAFGLAAVIIGKDYGMGTATKMGAAYFPIVLGGLLTLIGAASLTRAFFRRGEPLGAFAYKKAAVITASIMLFGLILRGAGLPIALTLLVFLSASTSRHFRWIPTLGLAIALSVFCVLVFIKGLGLPLSVLGSWFGG